MRILLFFVITMTIAAEASEVAWLREVDGDHGKKGLPSFEKEFKLKRSSGEVKLKLKENMRLNPMAPVYKVVKDSDGKNRLVRKTYLPKLKAKFYQSKENHGAFKMTYDSKRKRSILSGSFFSDDEVLNMDAAPDVMTSQELLNDTDDTAYILEPESTHKAHGKNAYRTISEDYKTLSDAEVEEELKNILSQKALKKGKKALKKGKKALQKGKPKRHRRRRETNTEYAVELFVTADEKIWQKFYNQTSEGDGLTREQATELKLREHFVHIVNGMSLRYQSIEDPLMNIYLTISGFLFFQTRDNTSHPLPQSANITVVDGEELVDGYYYLASLVPWAANLTGLPHNDHIAVFTDYDLYGLWTNETGRLLTGIAYLNSICGTHRVSIMEDNDWFTTVSVLAHEVGHSLGAWHDGETETSDCPGDDKYIMAAVVTLFGKNDTYTPNAWTFSSCSIEAFKARVEALGEANCLLDAGDIYDTSEHQTHLELLPGQLRTADEQCKWEWTENSFVCTTYTKPTDDTFCLRMTCFDNGLCHDQVPAMGTDCGEAGATTYCINGVCVNKSAEHTTDTGQGDTNDTTDTDNTANENTDAGDQTACEDAGYLGYDCSYLDGYFQTNYNYGPTQWCQYTEWEAVCCAYCQAACIDVGYVDSNGAQWTCGQLSDAFLQYYQYTPATWCLNFNWKADCCAFCAANGV